MRAFITARTKRPRAGFISFCLDGGGVWLECVCVCISIYLSKKEGELSKTIFTLKGGGKESLLEVVISDDAPRMRFSWKSSGTMCDMLATFTWWMMRRDEEEEEEEEEGIGRDLGEGVCDVLGLGTGEGWGEGGSIDDEERGRLWALATPQREKQAAQALIDKEGLMIRKASGTNKPC